MPDHLDLALVPGLNNTSAVFDRLRPLLGAQVRAHALDNPPLSTVEAIAQAHLATLPERFWLAGFSFGGYVAMALLEAAPQRVQGIALLCSAPFADPPQAAARRQAGIDAALAGRHLAMVSEQAAQAFHPDSLNDPALMRERMDMVRAYGAERYVAHVRATIARPDRHHLLIGDRPTLVVGGSHDSLFTPDALAAWAGGIPGARHVTVAGAGHLVPMEQPAALSQALRTWMHAA